MISISGRCLPLSIFFKGQLEKPAMNLTSFTESWEERAEPREARHSPTSLLQDSILQGNATAAFPLHLLSIHYFWYFTLISLTIVCTPKTLYTFSQNTQFSKLLDFNLIWTNFKIVSSDSQLKLEIDFYLCRIRNFPLILFSFRTFESVYSKLPPFLVLLKKYPNCINF